MSQKRMIQQTKKITVSEKSKLEDAMIGDIVCILSGGEVVNLGMVGRDNTGRSRIFSFNSSGKNDYILFDDQINFRYPNPGEVFEIAF